MATAPVYGLHVWTRNHSDTSGPTYTPFPLSLWMVWLRPVISCLKAWHDAALPPFWRILLGSGLMAVADTRIPSRSATGIILVIIALALAAFGGGLMKLLTDSLPPVMIAWARFCGSSIILLPFVIWHVGGFRLAPHRPIIQTARGVLMALGNIAFIFGVQHLDYANAIAILYVYPFIMVFLAPFVLGEKVAITGWIGVIGGFGGVLMVMRPDIAGLDYHALLVFLSGAMIAMQMLLNRLLGARSNPMLAALWGSVVATIVLTPFVPFFWSGVTTQQFAILALLAVTASVSQTLMILGMGRAAAGDVAPFTYTEIVSGIVLGFLMFGTLPDALAFMGMALIVASGILVARMRAQ